MSRFIIAVGLMGVASLISFIAGFAFCAWGFKEELHILRKSSKENRWN